MREIPQRTTEPENNVSLFLTQDQIAGIENWRNKTEETNPSSVDMQKSLYVEDQQPPLDHEIASRPTSEPNPEDSTLSTRAKINDITTNFIPKWNELTARATTLHGTFDHLQNYIGAATAKVLLNKYLTQYNKDTMLTEDSHKQFVTIRERLNLDREYARLQTTSKELATTSKELATTSKELATTSKELATTSKKLATTSKELAPTSKELDATKTKLDAKKIKLDATKKELDATKKELDATKKELKLPLRDFFNDGKREKLKTAKEQYDKDVTHYSQDNNALTAAVEQYDKDVTHYSQDNNAFTAAIVQFNKDVTHYSQDKDKFKTAKEQYGTDYANHQTAVTRSDGDFVLHSRRETKFEYEQAMLRARLRSRE